MRRIAITGHRGLPQQTTTLVENALRQEIDKRSNHDLVAISCLADGPDSIFARLVLENGGKLVVVVPAKQYRNDLPVEHHPTYDRLFAAATEVIELDYDESNATAHQAGNLRILDEADELIAVWDGQPARGHGGTADTVAAAHDRGIPVTTIWPDGALRD